MVPMLCCSRFVMVEWSIVPKISKRITVNRVML